MRPRSVAESDISVQLGDEPRPDAVFWRGAAFLFLQRSPAPSDQRRAVASLFCLPLIDADVFFFRLERDQQKFHHLAVVHLCHKPVTASSAAMRSRAWPEGRWRSLSAP